MLKISLRRRFYALVADTNAIKLFKIIEALFGLQVACIHVDLLSAIETKINTESNALNIEHDLVCIVYFISLEMLAHMRYELCSMLWAKNGSHFRLSY